MSKIQCSCGHQIVDQTDNLPYKATLSTDQEDWPAREAFVEQTLAFIQALRVGKRDEWIQKQMGKTYPSDLDDAGVLHDLMTRNESHQRLVYMCTACGRLWLDRAADGVSMVSFTPDANQMLDPSTFLAAVPGGPGSPLSRT